MPTLHSGLHFRKEQGHLHRHWIASSWSLDTHPPLHREFLILRSIMARIRNHSTQDSGLRRLELQNDASATVTICHRACGGPQELLNVLALRFLAVQAVPLSKRSCMESGRSWTFQMCVVVGVHPCSLLSDVAIIPSHMTSRRPRKPRKAAVQSRPRGVRTSY